MAKNRSHCGNRVYQQHARAFMRTLANPRRHIHENLPDIHESSGEGLQRSPEFWSRCLLYEGGLQNLPKKFLATERTFATKFASDCECDGLVHSGEEAGHNPRGGMADHLHVVPPVHCSGVFGCLGHVYAVRLVYCDKSCMCGHPICQPSCPCCCFFLERAKNQPIPSGVTQLFA